MAQKAVVRKRRTAPLSEYARQLQAKQELKKEYGLRERQFRRTVKEIIAGKRGKGEMQELLMQTLERRLDNVVFRMGLASTRAQARQLVSHGHILVNGRVAKTPSQELERNDEICLRTESLHKPLFQNVALAIKKHAPPSWILLEKEKLKAKVQSLPTLSDASYKVDLPLILAFYSR